LILYPVQHVSGSWALNLSLCIFRCFALSVFSEGATIGKTGLALVVNVMQRCDPPETLVDRLLVCVLQPALYGAATRLPLVFIGVHARQVLELSWVMVGVLVGTFQLARAAGNVLIRYTGAEAGHILGSLGGLIGYITLAVSSANSLPAFWAGTTAVGLSEVISSIQDHAKREYSSQGLPILRYRLRLLYACNVAGTAVGFGLGGVAYQTGGVKAAAGMGVLLEIGELVSVVSYLARRQEPQEPRHVDSEYDDNDSKEGDGRGGEEGIVSSVDTEALGASIKGGNGPPPSWINYALAATFAVQALMIGTVLSTGPLFLYTVHGIPVGAAGYLFAAAEAAGACVLFATLRSPGSKGNDTGSMVPVSSFSHF
jgi:hypothetical protein